MHPAPPAHDSPTTLAGRPRPSRFVGLFRLLTILGLIYLFLICIKLLGGGLKLLGQDFAEQLILATNNPFVGLFIGILSTSLVQSSSTTTSLVVAFVGAGTLRIENAVPIIMGANIGSTVTNILVSMVHIARRDEFKRALAVAMVHDFFNILVVTILLPLEIATGFLSWTATSLEGLLQGTGGLKICDPIKAVTQPVIDQLVRLARVLPERVAGVVLCLSAITAMIAILVLLVKNLRAAALGRLEVFFDRFVGRHGLYGIIIGLVITAVIQSSAVTISLLVPMAAAGILTVEQVFPITLGANIGTTVTAMLAALSIGEGAVAVALTHLLFNIIGTLLIYPLLPVRRIPIRMAKWMAGLTMRSRWYPVIFVLLLFFLLPLGMIFIPRLF